MEPQVTVVIPTRNRSSVLRSALHSLTQQTLPRARFEVIVVDNGSGDNTAAVSQEFAADFPHFQYLLAPKPGLHEGRHAGLKAASADLLTYADDDIVAFDTWLEGVLQAFQDPDVGLVGGKDLPQWEQSPPHWLWELWFTGVVPEGRRLGALSLIDFGDNIQEIDPYYVYGCNFSVRKGLVLDAGGFHPDGMPQDLIAYRGDGESYLSGFVKARGLKTLYHPKASVHHLVPANRMNQDYFQKRSFNQGVSDSFAVIRANGAPLAPDREPRWRKLLRKIVDNQLLRRDVYQLHEELQKGEFQRAVERSYRKGFEYHQQSCRNHPEILEWVLRDTYLD